MRAASRHTTVRFVCSPIRALAIAASTGGPEALERVLSAIPEGFAAPIFVVQHTQPAFTGMLAERLSKICKLPVREAVNGETVVAGRVYLAPGDRHLEVVRDHTVRTHRGPTVASVRPAADVLFRSIATTYGESALVVVLTGMGQDGLEGVRACRATGAAVLVQDAQTSVVWGMPGAVARAGLADGVHPLDELATIIARTRVEARS